MTFTNHDGTWTLTNSEYERLIDADRFLAALEVVGVDNWDGYETACQLYSGEITEEEI